MKSLILAGTAQGIFLVLLLTAERRTSSGRILIAWLIMLSFQLLFYYDNLSSKPMAPRWLALICFALPLLSSAVLYLYIRSLSFRSEKIWLHAVPFVLYTFILYCMPVNDVRDGYPHFALSVAHWVVDLLFYVLAFVPATYVLLCVIVLWRLQKLLAFSFALVFTTLFALIRFGAPYGLVSYNDLFAVVGTVLAFYVFFIGYYTLRFPSSKPRYQNSGLSDGTAKAIFARLTLHMHQQQPFLSEGLTLDLLSAELNVPPHHLSQTINQLAGVNFFSFVNSYRVEAVKARLKDSTYAHYSILGIAYDCGFRSKSSFNKIFKEMTGETPTFYQSKRPSLPVRTTEAAS